jgi:hypothetical protein
MIDREGNRRSNDVLQHGENNPAYGDDERDSGAGKQTAQEPLSRKDAQSRRICRDPTVPRGQPAARIGGRR